MTDFRSMLLLAIVMPLMGTTLAAAPEPATQPAYLQALAPRTWSFPRDHGRHDGFKTEWWYFTGNLRDDAGRRFGYQLTFFRTALAPDQTTRPSPWAINDLYFAHAAISDIAGNRFVYRDRLERGRAGLALASDHSLDVDLLDWSLHQDEKGIHLKARDDDLEIDLTCAGGSGPVLEGPGGVNAKGRAPGEASYYYSMTRLQTSGKLNVGGQTFSVRGLSWMDHEFSINALAKNQVGWDWMGLQLNDGTALMVYRLRDTSGGSDYLSGTRITSDALPHYLSAKDLSIQSSNPWKSAATGAAYPQEWKINVAGSDPITVRSLMPGQELMTGRSTKVSYFEGAAQVLDPAGREIGEGYLEMTGYAKSLGQSY
jgi:predicted secreted hydrolase